MIRTQPKCLFIDLGAGSGSDLEALRRLAKHRDKGSGGVLTILRVQLVAVFLVVDQMTSLLRRFVLLLCQAFAQDKFGPVGNCPSGDWEAILVEALAEWVLKPGGG